MANNCWSMIPATVTGGTSRSLTPATPATRKVNINWAGTVVRFSDKLTPHIFTYRNCCTDEAVRSKAATLQASFRKSGLHVPFVWTLLAAAQELKTPHWLATDDIRSSHRCMYFNYGEKEFSCNKADEDGHRHSELHRCFMCGGSHPLRGWELETEHEKKCCPAWTILSGELKELAKAVGVEVKVLLRAFFGDGSDVPTEVLTITEVVPLQAPAQPQVGSEQQSSPPGAFAATVATESPKIDLAVYRRRMFENERDTALDIKYTVEVENNVREFKPATFPKHNVRLSRTDGSLSHYTIFCDGTCCLVTEEPTRHRVYFGHFYITAEPSERATLAVVKVFRNVTTAANQLKADTQFKKETDVALQLGAVLEAQAKVMDLTSNSLQTLLVMKRYHSSLRLLLVERNAISNDERLQLVQCLCDAMRNLHTNSTGAIVHGDVKPSNILVYKESDATANGGAAGGRFKAQFCDFEFASISGEGPPASAVIQASAGWAHPRQWITAGVTLVQYDLWALALILYEVFHFRKHNTDDDKLSPLFFNDLFPGTVMMKREEIDALNTKVKEAKKINPDAPLKCVTFPPTANVLLQDLMRCLMCEGKPCLQNVRDHLLLVPPMALAQGLLAIRADEGICDLLLENPPCRKPYFKKISSVVFDAINKQALHYFQEFKSDQDADTQQRLKFRPKANTDWITVADGVRVLRNLCAHPTASFNASSLYFDAPEFLLDLGAKLKASKIRINKVDGSLERY